MFKAKIVLNNNGKQTVLEFDNEQEYYNYLESHPEINQQFSWGNNFPSFNLPFEWFNRVNALADQWGHHLPHTANEKDLSPMALVKHDMRKLEQEEKRKAQEEKEKERRKELEKKELEEAKELLSAYKSKSGHDPEYAKRLEDHIARVEKAE